MRHYLYVLFIILLSFVSCETDLPEGTWSKEPPTTVTYQLSVNKTTIIVGAEGASETFGITSDDSWTVSASESWIKISDATGAGDKTVTVTVEANTDKEARSGTITVKGKSSGSKSISVSQSGKVYSLFVDKTEITVIAAESTETFTITSDDDWTVNVSESWVKVSAASGSGNKTITATIDANTSKETRTATITTTGKNSGIEKSITITQQPVTWQDDTSFNNGYEYVDLGLPSGLLWATCNVGASKPEDYGDYFAWGESTAKSIYDWSTYKYCKGSLYTLTKYNNSSSYGTVDNKTVLDPEDDAAHVNWGGSWRMPTLAEVEELQDAANCTWSWTSQNGVMGYKVTSKKNNKSLFFPAAGYRSDSDLHDTGSGGNYWSSSLDTDAEYYAYYFNVSWGSMGWMYYYRYYGQSVRAVCASRQ